MRIINSLFNHFARNIVLIFKVIWTSLSVIIDPYDPLASNPYDFFFFFFHFVVITGKGRGRGGFENLKPEIRGWKPNILFTRILDHM